MIAIDTTACRISSSIVPRMAKQRVDREIGLGVRIVRAEEEREQDHPDRRQTRTA